MKVVGQKNDSRQGDRSLRIGAIMMLSSFSSCSSRYRRAVMVGLILVLGVLLLGTPAHALTIERTTWDIIGLDSNLVTVGPNIFPVGVKVTNDSGETRTITVTFAFLSSDPYINLRAGTENSLTFTDVPAGESRLANFEVEVTRDSNAYEHKRGYQITATDSGGSVSTPSTNELYVEHLLSQSRNAVLDIQLSTDGGNNYTSFGIGNTMTLMVGQTYFIKLLTSTATNGYEQLEDFINFPNSVFQVLSVSSLYTADSSATVPNPNPQIYADGCVWDGEPTSNNYSSCLSTGKAGGDIVTTYEVKILQKPPVGLSNPIPLSTLIYDFSGSSYHYNSDYGVVTSFNNIVDASIEKSFDPVTVNPNTLPPGTSTLTFSLNNPGPDPISSVNFVDYLPTNGGAGQMTLADTTVTYTDCGASPSPASVTVGATSLSFSGITIAGLSTCTIAVTVTVDATGTYDNDSENLFIDTYDTGDDAKATLVATDKPPGPSSCSPASTLATWNMPDTTIGPAPAGPPVDVGSTPADVATATSTYALAATSTTSINTAAGSPAVNSWEIAGGWPDTNTIPTATTAPYFEFQVDTSNYGGAAISFDVEIADPGDWTSAGADNIVYVWSSTDGSTWSAVGNFQGSKGKFVSSGTLPAVTTGVNTTYFRINAKGATKPAAYALVDNVSITGCPRPEYPTLSKSFASASVCKNSSAALTFTFTNPNGSSLTGVGFSDTLPTGLLVNTPNGLSSVTCTTGSSTGQTVTATAGTSTISMSGATLAANSSCSFSVDIQGVVEGDYTNVSSSITSTETGPSTASTGYGTADLAVPLPPVISKSFGTTNLITGESTSLSFSITNPNNETSLTGVAFTDTLPSGLVVATPNGLSGTCGGGTITATAASGSISLSGATLSAGSSCNFSVDVTGSTAGTKSNSVTVTSTEGCGGNTATAELNVRALIPAIALTKQVGPSASGPWYKYLGVATGATVYYRFIVENTGEVPLYGISVTDPTLCSSGDNTCSCTWTPDPIPVADTNDDDHIETCVPTETITAPSVEGTYPNTATVHSWLDSGNTTAGPTDEDTATYEVFVPTAVRMGIVKLTTLRVSDFLGGIGVPDLDAAGLLNLLNAWDPAAAEGLQGAGRDELLAVIRDYLDPDGDGQLVVLRWETIEERGTIGFYAERRQDGGWTRISAKMLPGMIAAPMGAQYWLADPGAQPDQSYQYRLIEVEARGTTREYGPFDLTVGSPSNRTEDRK